MRRPSPDSRPIALTIAGSDSGGGAGIQADLATMAAHEVYGTSAITAVTAQHTRGVESSHVLPRAEVAAQIDAVREDFAVGAAKTGMLATTELVELVAERAADVAFPVVVDPVMVATSGDRLLDSAAERAYATLIAEAALVTPNADEAAVLTDVAIEDEASARRAGDALLDLGADAALLKGGHVPGETVRDVLVTADGAADGSTTFDHPRVDTDATHGSGCALSAAITARLAAGDDLHAAVERATDFVADAIRYHYDVGRGPGAVNHFVGLRNRAARDATAAAVRTVRDRLVAADVSPLVPETGLDIVGATPFAETADSVAAVDGGLHRTLAGVVPAGEVRFGTADPLAHVLLAAREHRPALRYAATCRFDDPVGDALDALDWAVAGTHREAAPDADEHSDRSTAVRLADRAFGADAYSSAADDRSPIAVVDHATISTEPTTTIVATDPETLGERVIDLAAMLE